ncbi:hypothetical protein DSL72_000967 [Monilinia vaccinii-corymbosi]|uniref:Uncharacterized protein n=1 Tax=Monilinia vaccinii-corymbosi TaxID=61207 RepID=A0A8A3P2X3_9HELO|nr:hypothetical protein DSL72_000967 [Monilinia vaccinii-corymbosi]
MQEKRPEVYGVECKRRSKSSKRQFFFRSLTTDGLLLPWNHNIEDLIICDDPEAGSVDSRGEILAFDAEPMTKTEGALPPGETKFKIRSMDMFGGDAFLQEVASEMMALLYAREGVWLADYSPLVRDVRTTSNWECLENAKNATNEGGEMMDAWMLLGFGEVEVFDEDIFIAGYDFLLYEGVLDF